MNLKFLKRKCCRFLSNRIKSASLIIPTKEPFNILCGLAPDVFCFFMNAEFSDMSMRWL